MPKKEPFSPFSILGADFDTAYERYVNKKPEIHNTRIRPKGMDIFEWLSASKRGKGAKKV